MWGNPKYTNKQLQIVISAIAIAGIEGGLGTTWELMEMSLQRWHEIEA